MRAKSDIIAYLASQLTDDVWKKLQNSLLGRELLAFGAEVISENENVKDTMLLQMNPETADKNGLFMLSQMNEIPITSLKPSCVVVQMADNVKTYAPYELQYNIGNVHFTNIEYTMQGKSVSLINGTHKCWAVGMDRSEDSVADGSETFFYDGTTSYSGIKLGNAYPDSIVVTDENGLEIPRYSSDIALSDNIDMMYKVITGVDGNIYIRFLKGSDTIPNPTTYKIDWLDHSAMEFEVEDNEVKDGNNVVATVEYYSQGVEDDLDYMRQQLKKEMAKYNGLNTPISVESYVRGLPYILDAKCEKGEDGICVYVKPSSPTPDYSTYLDFSEVAAHISLNSILFPNIKVKTANQIMFGVEISGVSDLKLQQGIKSLLQERFAYENMDFNTIINTGSILSEIYSKYGVVPTINMTIKEDFVQNKPLSFTPIKNSLKLYDINDSVVAWEENDLLYGMVNNTYKLPFYMFDIVASMGTMFLLMYNGKRETQEEYTRDYRYLKGRRTQVVSSFPTTGISSEYIYIKGDEWRVWDDNTWVTLDEKPTYNTSFKYLDDTSYNKFYLYDVSTNVFKPFDGCMQNLLFSDKNPCLNYNAWNLDNQAFGNLYDINFLSTNNALVVQMIFKSSGTNTKEDLKDSSDFQNDITFNTSYWSENNMKLYEPYFNGSFVDAESITEYQGKYQTTFFINNPLALKNVNNESWQTFQDAVHGNPSELQGLYSGLRNIKTDGTRLSTKTNWFVYNNKSYYAYDISDNYVYITNGAKNMSISMNGTFLGMMPFEDDLYVINERYITRVIGFEGLKEKEVVYRVYKDMNTPISIMQIMREFDNQIVFKTSDNKFYTATGFEIYADNMIGFKDLKQVFDDNVTTTNIVLGGCTKDYITAYKIIDEPISGDANFNRKKGVKFYCYDLNTNKTKSYEKITKYYQTTDGDSSSWVEENVTENVSVWWGKSSTAKSIKGHYSRLFYKDKNKVFREIKSEDYKNLFFIRQNNGNNPLMLFIDNIDEYSYPVYTAGSWKEVGENIVDNYSDSSPKILVCSAQDAWEYDGVGGDICSDYVQGFYKQCLNSAMLLEMSSQIEIILAERNNTDPTGKPFYDLYNVVTVSKENNQIITTTEKRQLRTESVVLKNESGENADPVEKSCNLKLKSNVYIKYHVGSFDINQSATNHEVKKTPYIPDSDSNRYSWGTGVLNMSNLTAYDVLIEKYYKTTTTIVTESNPDFINEDDTKELAMIGYYDSKNNSLTNDKGTSTKYIRYYTQNPNITSGSYLMLDESEIKFI